MIAVSQPLPEHISELPSRVLNDVFHTMMNLAPSRSHSMAGIYQAKLRDAFFVVDCDDKAAVTEVLLQLGIETFEAGVLLRPKWIWSRVRRWVPPAAILLQRVKEVLDKFRDIQCPVSKAPMFTSSTLRSEPEIVELIRRGYLSDPPLADLFLVDRHDAHGLPVYRCLRGTNAVEGFHADLIKKLSAFNADAELLDVYLAFKRNQHNFQVCRTTIRSGLSHSLTQMHRLGTWPVSVYPG